jgi:chemotaxis protein CheZ
MSTHDSADLEALFDSIASAVQPAPAPVAAPTPAPVPAAVKTESGPATQDTDELEALFDSIALAAAPEEAPAAEQAPHGSDLHDAESCPADKVINRIGHMTRSLHDSLRELGYDKNLEKAAAAIPDARDRLNYVAAMTEQAAERVLNAVDMAQPVVERVQTDAAKLALEWQKMFDKQMDVEQFKALVTQTHTFLNDVPKQTKAMNAYLMEIMMAQDFQDLTGQVIKKIMEVTQQIEQQMVDLLVENMPAANKGTIQTDGLLNGPVINAEGRTDVVTNQDQVDELLDSLGF